MKQVLSFFALVAVFALFNSNEAQAQKMDFAETTIDYGTIEKGSNGVREFEFTNTGSAPLLIKHAKGSCGCTVPTYPKEPIMPGKSGVISVKYDTNRVGPFTKYVTLTTNSTDNTTSRLMIKGKVEPQGKATPAPQKKSMMAPRS